MTQYQPLPQSGQVQPGFYMSRYGRVWVTKAQPEWVHDTKTTGHYEERFQTELEGCGWVYPGICTVEQIIQGFEQRNLERRTSGL